MAPVIPLKQSMPVLTIPPLMMPGTGGQNSPVHLSHLLDPVNTVVGIGIYKSDSADLAAITPTISASQPRRNG